MNDDDKEKDLNTRESALAGAEAEVQRRLDTAARKITDANSAADEIREKARKDARRLTSKADALHKDTMKAFADDEQRAAESLAQLSAEIAAAREVLADVTGQVITLRKQIAGLTALQNQATAVLT